MEGTHVHFASDRLRLIRRAAVGVATLGILTTLAVGPAFAATTGVEVGVTANPTIGIASPPNATFGEGEDTVVYSNSTIGTISGSINGIEITDERSTPTGWSATIQSGALTSGGNTIAASNVTFTAINNLTAVGESSDIGDLDVATVPSTGLASAVEFLSAADGTAGLGVYTLNLGFDISVPAQTQVGTYTGSLTITLTPVE